MKRTEKLCATITIASALMALAGCSNIAAKSTVEHGPPATISAQPIRPVPRVQNCGVLDAGTPSRFVCDGKVYTSYQLAKLREDEAKKYGSGQ